MRRTPLVLALGACVLMGSNCEPKPIPDDLCLTPLVDDEPLCNPSLADSPWGISHRSSYAQASAAEPGPDGDAPITADHVILPGTPIALSFTSPYPDGGVAVWGSPVGLNGAVVKLDHDPFAIIDVYIPAEREPDPPDFAVGISGAYSAVDRDDRFIVGRTRFLEVYADSVAGDRASPIQLVKREFLPDGFFCRDDDVITGMVLTYDDHVAFVSEEAVVGVIPRDPARMTAANLRSLSLNGAACTDPTIPRDELELVSNSIAADEDGGIYVVTSEAMYKLRWDGEQLGREWTAGYEAGDGSSPIRLGQGSGSTPSLMGTTAADDRFVVITDGQDLMHLVLFWRDEIPDGWQPIAPGKDPRIACEFPVTFGDPAASASLSEQSVLVRGYASVLVSNLLQDESVFIGLPEILRNLLSALEGGNIEQAPRGIERIDWDPQTRTCRSVWANPVLSIPNGIPTMSEPTGLFYGIGQRDGRFGVEGVDFETGESAFFAPGSVTECPEQVFDNLPPLIRLVVEPVLRRLPGSCENSFYAGTEVGPDGAIVTGTWAGASKYTPAAVSPVPPLARGDAGIRQGIDLTDRALRDLPEDPAAALQWTRRGVIQCDAAAAALGEALASEGGAPPLTALRKGLVLGASAKLRGARELLSGPVPTPHELDAAAGLLARAQGLLLGAEALGGSR